MITGTLFRNFKSLRHVDIDLERLTVIVGPNASGKTSILEGLHCLSQACSVGSKETLVGQRRIGMLYSRGAIGKTMEIECKDTNVAIRLIVDMWPGGFGDPARVGRPSEYIDSGSQPRLEWRTLDEADADWKEITEKSTLYERPDPVFTLSDRLYSAVLLRLDAAKLAEPSYSGSSKLRVENDGAGMASVLALMAFFQLLRKRGKRSGLHQYLEEVEQRLVPLFVKSQ